MTSRTLGRLDDHRERQAKGLLSRIRGLTDAEWAERLDRVSEGQLTDKRPPATYGCFRGRRATPLEWRWVGGV